MKHQQRGFTLIELVIAVVIISILAAIAIPSYNEQIRKSRRAEAAASLMTAAQVLERCFTLHNTYDNSAPADTDANCPEGVPTSSDNGWYDIDYSVAATQTTYTLRATPQNDQTKDLACANLTITQAGQRSHTGTASATSDCW